MDGGLAVFFVVGIVALGVSALTLFSGFGLGTLLMPTFALFFPLEVAVAATAVVHGANGLFKVALLRRHAVGRVLWRFGVPAVIASFLGAFLLEGLASERPLWSWSLGDRVAEVTPLKAVMGSLIVFFATLDFLPFLRKLRFQEKWLPLGGLFSGFFGGLSGHQGALRAAFLRPVLLDPPSFAGTQAALAVMVDAARLLVYGAAFFGGRMQGVATARQWAVVGVATGCAFIGAYVGRRLLHKVTIDGLRWITGVLLLVVGMGLLTGVI